MIDASAPVEVFEEIDSTILEARRRVERGALEPVWLVARRQTAGRGRRGRVWASFDGNLLATALFTTELAPAEIVLWSFATGLSIAEALEQLGVARVQLKWPNDVMISAAKCAGVLIDSGALAGGRHWVALSFGINVSAAPKAIDQRTTSLREALPASTETPPALAVLSAVRVRLAHWEARLAQEGFEPLRAAWLARAQGVGEDVVVKFGETALAGRIVGLSARGELELDTAEGRRLIAAGDVFFSQAA